MPKPDPRKISAYGVIKRASVIASLPVEEQEELETLDERKKLSKTEQERLATLWDKAFEAHAERQRARQREYAEREARMRFYEQDLRSEAP
jgi:hypothetical protein